MSDPIEDLVESWRRDAQALERHGRREQADRLRRLAEEVEHAAQLRRMRAIDRLLESVDDDVGVELLREKQEIARDLRERGRSLESVHAARDGRGDDDA